MAQTTTRRPRTTTPSSRTARGRTRPSARASRGTTAQGTLRGTAQRATTITRGRRKQEPTGLKGLVAKLPDTIPGLSSGGKRSRSSVSRIAEALPFVGGAKGGKSSSAGSGKRAGGAALAAGAAGLAFKNRDRITSMIKRDGGQEGDTASPGASEAPPSRPDVTPTDVTTPPQSGSAG